MTAPATGAGAVARLDAAGGTLAASLAAAARIGATDRGGVSRHAWTPELATALRWAATELERLGLSCEIDAAGNLIGRWESGVGAPVMAGSHLDTVPDGGAFDGALGVVGAIEAVRLLRAEDFVPRRPIWVAAFMDEEGTRFGTSLFGSRAFAGHDLGDALAARDAAGVALGEAMAGWGRDPARLDEAFRAPQLAAYLELHVEQGTMLEEAGAAIGVVDAITGILAYDLVLRGAADHAGATPTPGRRDALVGAARIVTALRDHALAHPEMRATVGQLRVEPGAGNVIPGTTAMTIDARPSGPGVVEPTRRAVRDIVRRIAAEEGLDADLLPRAPLAPTPMDPLAIEALTAAAQRHGVKPPTLRSGAGHDAMVIAAHAPAGMLFVRSAGGISHSPDEWSEPDDCALAARVLAGALRTLAR